MTDFEAMKCRVHLYAGLDPWAKSSEETDVQEPSPSQKLAQAEKVECEVLDD